LYKLRLVLPFGVTLVTKRTFHDLQQAEETSKCLPGAFEIIPETDIDPEAIFIPLREKKPMPLSDAARFALANKRNLAEGDNVFVGSVLRRGIVSHIAGNKVVVMIDGIPLETHKSDLHVVNGLSY